MSQRQQKAGKVNGTKQKHVKAHVVNQVNQQQVSNFQATGQADSLRRKDGQRLSNLQEKMDQSAHQRAPGKT